MTYSNLLINCRLLLFVFMASMSKVSFSYATEVAYASDHRAISASLAIDGSNVIKVLTYNILRAGVEKQPYTESWYLQRGDKVSASIQSETADIIALQEDIIEQSDKILDDLGQSYQRVSDLGDKGNQYGDLKSIIYKVNKFLVEDSGRFWLSSTPTIPSKTYGNPYYRMVAWAKFKHLNSGKQFFLYNVHMPHRLNSCEGAVPREKSVVQVAEDIWSRNQGEPVIVTGDFNAASTTPEMQYLTSPINTVIAGDTGCPGVVTTFSYHAKFEALNYSVDPSDCAPSNGITSGCTFSSISPQKKIDHILVSDDISVIDSSVLDQDSYVPEFDRSEVIKLLPLWE